MSDGLHIMMSVLLHKIETEEAFADDLAWFAVDAETVGERSAAEEMRRMGRIQRVAVLMDRGRLSGLFAAYGLHAFEDD